MRSSADSTVGDWITGPHNAYVFSALVANTIIFGVLVFVGVLHETDYDLYYRSVQEDEPLEWATYWAFIGAAAVFAMAALRQWRSGGPVPWFLAGVSLFCFIVAMEEISWGQRVLSFRPPAYFLEHNYQQELNIHNVIDTDLRKIALNLVIGVYGCLLPVLASIASIRAWFDRIGIVVPPLAFVPAFAAIICLYQIYPWKFSGETVELMLGLGFLFTALWTLGQLAQEPYRSGQVAGIFVATFACVMTAGIASANISHVRKSSNPIYVDLARTEVIALQTDFETIAIQNSGRLATSCNVHKRVFSYWEDQRHDSLVNGGYAALMDGGLPEERAVFFLDPWNAPYWIRDVCPDADEGTPRRTFVYSFGPNMKRDSSRTEIAGDDIGVYIQGTGSGPN